MVMGEVNMNVGAFRWNALTVSLGIDLQYSLGQYHPDRFQRSCCFISARPFTGAQPTIVSPLTGFNAASELAYTTIMTALRVCSIIPVRACPGTQIIMIKGDPLERPYDFIKNRVKIFYRASSFSPL
jgi:hypothetical protein